MPSSQSHSDLAYCAERGYVTRALKICYKMKLDGITPNISVYHWLLEACAFVALDLESWAILEDMIAAGVQPDTTAINFVIKVRFAHDATLLRS